MSSVEFTGRLSAKKDLQCGKDRYSQW